MEVVPRVGLQFRHARLDVPCRVTAVRSGVIYYRAEGRYGSEVKRHCKAETFPKIVAEVTGQKERATSSAPKLNKRQIAALIKKAEAAGRAAGLAAVPSPMVVQQHANPLNDNSPVTREWFVSEGLCGFAWVTIRPATGALVNYLRANGKGHKGYHGGWEVWSDAVDHSGYQAQSITRNEAYARAYAEVLREAGFTAHASSRLD